MLPALPSVSRFLRRAVRYGALVLGCAVVLLGCEDERPPDTYVARVGDAYLTQDRLNEMMGTRVGLDTTEARQQIIEQWVNRTLLHQEALNRNLHNDPDVQQQLEEQRRTVLVTALTNRLYESFDVSPSESDVRSYFERHRAELQLREPYLRVRFLSTSSPDSAQVVRQDLAAADTAIADSLWTRLVQQHAAAPSYSQRLAERFFPESRLREDLPVGQDALARLDDGELAPVLDADSAFHVLQVVQRLDEGTAPQIDWVAPEIRRRLAVRARKQMYAREVQRLRNQAQARNALDIR